MMKSICTLTRRADFSRRQFQDYYENQHSPLAIQHFPFVRYVRNHVVGGEDIGFDTISEFWAVDVDKLANLMKGPVGQRLQEDERRFMDQSQIAPGYARETVISEGQGPSRRYALLLNWKASSGEGASGNKAARGKFDVLSWARANAADYPAISVDRIEAWQQPAFPARAVVWTPEPDLLTALPADIQVDLVEVERVETPPAQLLGNIQDADETGELGR